MREENLDSTLNTIEERVSVLERRLFGDEINSKIQQKRLVIDETIQINGQIHRAVANREIVSRLMKNVEDMMEFLDLEEGSQLLGGEAKANAVLAAEPIIRQMYTVIKGINLEHIHQAMNSEAIRNLSSLSGQLAKLKLMQMEQESEYDELCRRIRAVEEVIGILGRSQNSNRGNQSE